MDADHQPWSQAQLRALGDANDVSAGAQRIEDAPLADPLQVLGRPGAAQDRQPAQFVGLVAGRRVGQHVRLVVLDADHPVGAVGDGLGEAEQVGAGVVERIAAITVMFEGVVDELVEQFPAGPRFDCDYRRAERHRLLDRGLGGLLDEDGRRDPPARPADLLLDPAHGLGVGHAEQEEHVGGSRAERQPQPHVVGVDERHRAHRHAQPAGRLDQRHHRAVQGEQQLSEPQPGRRLRHHALLCPIRL